MRPGRLFCFGLGFTGVALARRLLAAGWRVAGTTRDESRRRALAAAGIEAMLFERGHPLTDPDAALAGTTHLLLSVPPDSAGDSVFDYYSTMAERRFAWVGYLSTTGVYGDHGGGVVCESTPPAPTGDRQRRRLAAERAWQGLHAAHGLPLHVFRLAGIYGPGRSALDAVRAGTARRVDLPGQVFSRIHVEDIVTTLLASIARPNPGATYNLCDDYSCPAHEVIAHACALLTVPAPPLVPLADADLGAMARSFYADNKRVSNERIRRELGVTLAYPSYREGLAAQLAAGQ